MRFHAGVMAAVLAFAAGSACSDDPPELAECPDGPPAAGEARAKVIGCDAEKLDGTVAMGRTGDDLVIENAEARFIIRGSDGSASFLGTGAGGLVDAAPQGGVDLIKDVLPLTGLSAIRPTDVAVTEAVGERAAVRVEFEMEVVGLLAAVAPISQATEVRGTVDYELAADDPVLHVTVRLTPLEGVAEEDFTPGFGVLVGGAADLFQPGGEGARMVLEGPESATALRMTLDGQLSEIQSINLLQGNDRLTATSGEEVTYELRVAVGTTAAEAWNAAGEGQGGLGPLTVTGEPGDRVEILDADDVVAMRTRLDDAGEATVRLPPGTYRARAGFDRWFPGALQEAVLDDRGATVDVGSAPSGTLTVDATAQDKAGAPEAAPIRVTVQEAGGGAEVARVVAVGPTDFRLPPADYQVTLSRGPEFEIVQQEVTLADGDNATVGAALDRVMDTTGWVAGDFHLHSEMSTDSRHWLGDALRIVAAEGLDVVAATDHDFITDYDRHMARAGVEGWVLTVPGSEVSHPLIAHVNGYPLERDPSLSANGSPPWFMSAPGEWFDAIRARGDTSLDPAGALVQVNHPRRSSSGLFESIGLDRTTGTATVSPSELGLEPTADLNDLSVDAVEVWNKSPNGDDEESLLDYLALYSLGHDLAMMGNSDTHDNGRPAGSMRTFIQVPDEGDFTWQDVAEGIRSHNVTVCGGIFVTASVVSVAGGMADVEIDVQAPPWVQVQRLRIYAGAGDIPALEEDPFTTTGTTTHTVPLDGASFVVVRVDGGRGDPVLRHSTLGITNPIDIP